MFQLFFFPKHFFSSNYYLDNIKSILILRILKWNHLLLCLKRRALNCICFKSQRTSNRLSTQLYVVSIRGKIQRKMLRWKYMRAFQNEFVLTFIWVSRIILFYYHSMSFKNNTKKIIPVLGYALNYCLQSLFDLCFLRSSHWEVFVK